MKKNLIKLIATSFVALLLVGCGSSGKKVSKPTVTATPTATATATATATPTSTATPTPDNNSSGNNNSGNSGDPLPF